MEHAEVRAIDHVKFTVGNALQSAYFYRMAFGFEVVAYSGLETGAKDEAAYLLQQGNIRFVLASPLGLQNSASNLLARRGDAVTDIAFQVDNVARAYEVSILNGAEGILSPSVHVDIFGSYESATIGTYGTVQHTLINRESYCGLFAPGFSSLEQSRYASNTYKSVGLLAIDHVVGNVEKGKLDFWIDFYRRALGFEHFATFDKEDISTQYSALMSKVVQGGRGIIKFPINEPADGLKQSQISEFLDFNNGPGVQHIALLTDDIIATVQALRGNDVSFLRIPRSYYDRLPSRVSGINERIEELAKLGILADRDNAGYMFQIFTKPIQDRPTFFFEIIQRKGSNGFGKGNFKALFEAIEQEQFNRGTL